MMAVDEVVAVALLRSRSRRQNREGRATIAGEGMIQVMVVGAVEREQSLFETIISSLSKVSRSKSL